MYGLNLHAKKILLHHTHIQTFSVIKICPYHNVWPGAVYYCFYKKYSVYKYDTVIANTTTYVQSFRVWYGFVCELRCFEDEEYLEHSCMHMIFWTVNFDELNHVQVSNIILKLKLKQKCMVKDPKNGHLGEREQPNCIMVLRCSYRQLARH